MIYYNQIFNKIITLKPPWEIQAHKTRTKAKVSEELLRNK